MLYFASDFDPVPFRGRLRAGNGAINARGSCVYSTTEYCFSVFLLSNDKKEVPAVSEAHMPLCLLALLPPTAGTPVGELLY